jgi:hypothetical protein
MLVNDMGWRGQNLVMVFLLLLKLTGLLKVSVVPSLMIVSLFHHLDAEHDVNNMNCLLGVMGLLTQSDHLTATI